MAPVKAIRQWIIDGEKNGFDELKFDTVAFPECGEMKCWLSLVQDR